MRWLHKINSFFFSEQWTVNRVWMMFIEAKRLVNDDAMTMMYQFFIKFRVFLPFLSFVSFFCSVHCFISSPSSGTVCMRVEEKKILLKRFKWMKEIVQNISNLKVNWKLMNSEDYFKKIYIFVFHWQWKITRQHFERFEIETELNKFHGLR